MYTAKLINVFITVTHLRPNSITLTSSLVADQLANQLASWFASWIV